MAKNVIIKPLIEKVDKNSYLEITRNQDCRRYFKLSKTIVAVSCDHLDRLKAGLPKLPSLVVSPPSVTGHWYEEIEKFVPETLQVLHYTGNSSERKKLQVQIDVDSYNILVASYEVVRNDADFFKVIFVIRFISSKSKKIITNFSDFNGTIVFLTRVT